MRILMLSPDAQMIDRRIIQEARTLVSAGHHVELLSGFECAQADAYEDHGISVKRYTYDWLDRRKQALERRIGARKAKLAWPFVRLATRLSGGPNNFESFVLEKILEQRFDFLHVHDFPLLRVANIAAQARNVPLLYDSHEFYPIQSCFPIEDQKRYLARERKLVRECVQVITVNPYIAKMIGEAHEIPHPAVILNASELPQETARSLDPVRKRGLRLAKGLPPDDVIFVYQGWLSPERNLEPMVEAMGRMPKGATLLIIGYGEFRAVLEAAAEKAGATDRVLFYGRVESDDLPEITRLCDVGIVPYRAVDEMHRYCSPNKLFEFISAQIPILASDLPYLRDVIAGYGIGWLGDLESAEAVSKLMREIMADSDGLERTRAALPAASEALNWTVEGEKLLGIYQSFAPPRKELEKRAG